MSDPRYIDFRFLDSQKQYFPLLGADNGILASPNGIAGTRYCSHDSTHSISAVGGHYTVAGQSPRTAYPSTIHRRNPPLAPAPYTSIGDPPIVASSMEMSSPSPRQDSATSPSALYRRNPTLIPGTYTDIRHPTEDPSMNNCNPPLTPSAYTDIRDPPIVASSMEMSPPSLMQGPATSPPLTFYRRNPTLTPGAYTDIRHPTEDPSVNKCNPLLTPSTYTNIRDLPIVAPPPTEMSSPPLMHGPAGGQSPTISDSSTRRLNPSYTQFCGRRHFRCECSYETNRKSDFDRHREGIHHEGKRHHCPFPHCTKSYTRKYTLEKHESTHFNNNH